MTLWQTHLVHSWFFIMYYNACTTYIRPASNTKRAWQHDFLIVQGVLTNDKCSHMIVSARKRTHPHDANFHLLNIIIQNSPWNVRICCFTSNRATFLVHGQHRCCRWWHFTDSAHTARLYHCKPSCVHVSIHKTFTMHVNQFQAWHTNCWPKHVCCCVRNWSITTLYT
jgi:hypothetical protein